MARCGTCGNALCACRIYQDGAVLLSDQAGFPVAANTSSRSGRRTTVVAGNGTAGNPYEISFIDSLEFRPQAGEFARATGQVAGGSSTEVEFEFIVYQTPSDRPPFLFATGFEADMNLTNLEFLFVGAEARFSGGALGQNKMMISFSDGVGGGVRFIGGHTTQFRSGMTTSVLTGSGFINPLETGFQAQSGGVFGVLRIHYSSVDPLVSAKLWTTTT